MSASEAAPSSQPTLGPHHLRLFALLIDYLLIVVALNLAQQALLGADWDLQPVPESRWAALWPRLAWGFALFVLKDAAFGASPGKWFTGIAVRRSDDPERAASRGALALRNGLLVLLPIEAVLVFIDPCCRRLGDRLAGTVVVSLPRPAALGRRMLAFTVIVLASLLAGLLVAPWNMRRSAAYREAARIVAADPRVTERAGAGAQMGESPSFDLRLEDEESRATIGFDATGAAGTAHGKLVLRMAGEPRHWVRESLSLDEPTLTPSEAPPGGR